MCEWTPKNQEMFEEIICIIEKTKITLNWSPMQRTELAHRQTQRVTASVKHDWAIVEMKQSENENVSLEVCPVGGRIQILTKIVFPHQ